MGEKFKLGKKWFWIGIVMGFNPIFGLIYGIALLLEKAFRKEALIIIVWTLIWSLVLIPFVVGPFITAKLSKLFPQLLRPSTPLPQVWPGQELPNSTIPATTSNSL